MRGALLGFGICCLLGAAEPAPQLPPPPVPQKVEVSKTEKSDFPSGGALHLKNSIGELTIEGWDQPGLEITTIKSSKVAVEGQEHEKAVKLLDSVKITMERKGDEAAVTTEFPKHSKLMRPFKGLTDFDLDYVIKVPRNTRITVDHNIGEVHIDGILGEIHATDHMGLITVLLPEGQYSIDAMSKIGSVDSDFSGSEKSRKLFGKTFLASGSAGSGPGSKIFLRIYYGDLIIQKMHHPAPPPSGVPSVK
ncbi:MAG TPA: hypothetical protein VGG72_13775 [Bryobacteraceae bacterium]|jgi:hypothetical protein